MRPARALAPVLVALMGMAPALPAWAAQDRAGPANALLRGLPPAPGHYDAVLCVTVGQDAPSCGPVTADIGSAGQALVRVSDIAYRLELYSDQLGVTLFHGTMQIDGFFASYQWSGNQLTFNDADKATRYELKLGTRRFDTP
jgi:hypothetical protein